MPSPDVRPYVDLTVLDVTAQELADKALLDLAVKLPGWTPREGNTEVMLIEALALEAAAIVNALNRIPGAVLEALLGLYGLDRSTGTAAVVEATITAVDALGHDVPTGTRFRLAPADGTTPLIFATTEDVTIVAGTSSAGTVLIAEEATARLNGYPPPARLDLVDVTPGIDRAELAAAVTGGIDPEDGPAFLARAVTRLGRLVDTLVLPSHFTTRVLEELDVARAVTLDNTLADGTSSTGHVTVGIAGPSGAVIGSGRRTALETILEAQALASLDVHVIPATVTALEVEVDVVGRPGARSADITAAVEAAIAELVDPDAWGWSATVRLNDLIAAADHAAGVDYVADVRVDETGGTPTAADLALTGVANLVELDTVTVAVTEVP